MTGTQPPPPGASAESVLRAVKHRWWVLVAATVVGAIVGLGLSLIADETYSSTSTTTVNPITNSLFPSGAISPQVDMDTEAAVMASPVVRKIAAESLGDGSDAASLREVMTVGVPGQALALAVDMEAPTAELAARRSLAMTEAYLKYRQSQAEEHVDEYVKRTEAQISALTKSLRSASDGSGVSEALASLRSDQAEARTLVVDPGNIIQPGAVPSEASAPRLVTYVAGGAAIGLLVGLGLVLWTRRD